MNYENQYYDPSHEAGYAGARNLVRVNAQGKSVEGKEREKERIYEWLSNQDTYTLHRPIRKKFPRLQYNVTNIDDLWELDLCQLTSLKNENDGYSYLLVVIDVLSKYLFVEPLRTKSANEVALAFEKILKRANQRIPVWTQSDRGGEFLGAPMQKLLKKYSIRFRVARNPDVKAAVVERVNRTIKERMWRYFTHHNTHRYIDVLDKLVYAYNNTLHSSTKMKPSEVNLYNAAKARENLQRRAIWQNSKKRLVEYAKYKVGDFVRISRSKGTFAKGFEKNYSEEIFKIGRVSRRQGIYTYELQDLNGESIDGFFYTEELTLVGKKRLSADEQFQIESVVKTKGKGKNKLLLVKWRGYPEKFNSWIKASEVQSL